MRAPAVTSAVAAVAILLGCSLINSLDFVGNSNQAKTDAGSECAEPCSGEELCQGGRCECPAGKLECDDACIESLQDAGYCGQCGTVCRSDQICGDNGCSCPAGETDCGTACMDLSSDSQHCGDCNMACSAGQTCTAGKCSCPAGTTDCGATCVDLSSESQHCGDCNTACSTGRTCCSMACADLSSESQHCGDCNIACSAGQTCTAGKCSCPAGTTGCGTACADLSSDSQHCGDCNIACSSGQACTAGKCRSSPCDGFCSNSEAATVASDGYRAQGQDGQGLGTGEHCIEVQNYIPTATNARIVCWNFDSARTLQVNGQLVPPDSYGTGAGYALTPQSSGWYCVQVGAGNYDSAGVLLPTQ